MSDADSDHEDVKMDTEESDKKKGNSKSKDKKSKKRKTAEPETKNGVEKEKGKEGKEKKDESDSDDGGETKSAKRAKKSHAKGKEKEKEKKTAAAAEDAEDDAWNDLDKKEKEKENNSGGGGANGNISQIKQIDIPSSSSSATSKSDNTSTALVPLASAEKKQLIVSPNEIVVTPNQWLETHPNYFSRIKIPQDIHIEKWMMPEGFRNAGTWQVRISHRKAMGNALQVVGPWTAVYKAFFTMDGNAYDAKAQEYMKDKTQPHLEASYVINYLNKAWNADNDNGKGYDKDVCAYIQWWADLSKLYYGYVVEDNNLFTSPKNLDENPSRETLHKRLIKNYRAPILGLPPRDPKADSKTKEPLPLVDPNTITECGNNAFIMKSKAPVYKTFIASGSNPKPKPPASPFIISNEKMRTAYDKNAIWNPVMLFKGKSKVAVPYNLVKVLAKDIISDMVEVKPNLLGLDTKTNTPLFSLGRRLLYARILKRNASVNIDEIANRQDDSVELAGEEFIDFEAESENSNFNPNPSSSSGSGSGGTEDTDKANELFSKDLVVASKPRGYARA